MLAALDIGRKWSTWFTLMILGMTGFVAKTTVVQKSAVSSCPFIAGSKNPRHEDMSPPPKMNECPLKRGPSQKEISSSNHQFSGGLFFPDDFGGEIP